MHHIGEIGRRRFLAAAGGLGAGAGIVWISRQAGIPIPGDPVVAVRREAAETAAHNWVRQFHGVLTHFVDPSLYESAAPYQDQVSDRIATKLAALGRSESQANVPTVGLFVEDESFMLERRDGKNEPVIRGIIRFAFPAQGEHIQLDDITLYIGSLNGNASILRDLDLPSDQESKIPEDQLVPVVQRVVRNLPPDASWKHPYSADGPDKGFFIAFDHGDTRMRVFVGPANSYSGSDTRVAIIARKRATLAGQT